jgi:hypothetical protein
MRFFDAAHVDRSGFHARQPLAGGIFRLAGYAVIGLAVCAPWTGLQPGWLLAAALSLWLVAWYRQVGACWRAPLVAAALATSLQVVLLRGGW